MQLKQAKQRTDRFGAATQSSEGAGAVAEDVKNIFYSASVSTELLMGVRFYLAKMPANLVSPSTMDRIKNHILEIDKILSR